MISCDASALARVSSMSLELPSVWPAGACSTTPDAVLPMQAACALSMVMPPLSRLPTHSDSTCRLSLPPSPVSIVSACEQERPLNWMISFTRSWRYLTMSHMVGAA